MHPRSYYYCECCQQKEDTLEELKAKVMKIAESINCIANSELSYDVKTLAINELKEKKAKLIELMHKKVDEL